MTRDIAKREYVCVPTYTKQNCWQMKRELPTAERKHKKECRHRLDGIERPNRALSAMKKLGGSGLCDGGKNDSEIDQIWH